MHFRLGDQHLSVSPQGRFKAVEKIFLIGHLMNHPEGQDKFNPLFQFKIICGTEAGADPVGNAAATCAPLHGVQHFLLEINSNNLAAVANQAGHAN